MLTVLLANRGTMCSVLFVSAGWSGPLSPVCLLGLHR